MCYSFSNMIPITNKHIDLSLLHPRFMERLELYFADGRIKGKVAVASGCRSHAEQKRLYDKYRAGRGNLAANPDWKRPGGFFYGSFHQEQPDGFSYAVDLRVVGGITKPEATRIARLYGFRPTVASEWWHFQPRNEDEWFPSTSAPDDEAPAPVMDWAGVLAFIAAVGHSIGRSPLSRGRRGIEVKVVQQRLNALDFWCGTADGVFGRKTTKAVRQLQRTALRDTTGVVTGNLWAIMCDPEVPRGL
jgi:hypothetical protein